MKKYTADIAVIGAGVGGLAVGLAGSEKGLKVLCVDKTDHIGGVNDGLNGIMMVDTRITREKGPDIGVAYSKERAFKELMDHNHWRSDPRVCSTLVRKSGELMDWLEDTGVKFDNVWQGGTDHTIENMMMWGGGRDTSMYKRMHTTIPPIMAERGSGFLMETTVKKILMEDGKVAGLQCEDNATGEEVIVEAPVVVCASGGFSDNPEMLEEATGLVYGETYFPMLAQYIQMDGSGIKMCWEAGAGKSAMIVGDYMTLATPFDGPGGTRPDIAVLGLPAIIVNKQGDRFMDETLPRGNPGFAGNAMMTQPGKTCYSIIPSSIFRPHFEEIGPVNRFNEPYGYDVFMKAVDEMKEKDYPFVFTAKSLEEVAEKAGMLYDALKETIDEFNAMVDDGEDWEFFRNPATLKRIEGDEFFVAQWTLSAYGSLGGVLVDDKARCLTGDHEVVPGLYCVGMDSSTINGDSYHMGKFTGAYGGYTYTMGREAGYDALRYINSLK